MTGGYLSSGRTQLTRLVGGPHDGTVAETHGWHPTFLMSDPRPIGLFDEPTKAARWNPGVEWYEVPDCPRAGCSLSLELEFPTWRCPEHGPMENVEP